MKMKMKLTRRQRQKERRRRIYLAPNLVTTASLFCGFYSILMSSQGEFSRAAWFIAAASLFDLLDGMVARVTHSQSPFGREYDSLCDLVSFGVAPAILIYFWSLQALGRIGWSASFLFAACAALRLARYNILTSQEEQKKDFVGLASTVAGTSVASLVLFSYYLGIEGIRVHSYYFLLVTYVLGLMMVSPFPYRSQKDLFSQRPRPFQVMIVAVLIFTLLVTHPEMMLAIGCTIYSFSAPVEWMVRKLRKEPVELGMAGQKKQEAGAD